MLTSPLSLIRQNYLPRKPSLLTSLKKIAFKRKDGIAEPAASSELQLHFPKTYGQSFLTAFASTEQERSFQPLKVAVLFSGGQASGGHNVISGLFDALKEMSPYSELIGFLNGPLGLINGKYKELTKEIIAPYRNQGGFDLIGSGRTKIETPEQLLSSLKIAQQLKLDGLVIIGGDDSNTNAALLAEYFLQQGCSTKVVGVPKTIDGDLKNDFLAISFGFDTACKVYAEIIGNIARDALSAKKYTHFIKVMGRSASHIALECALLTHPNAVLVSEEIALQKSRLHSLTCFIADIICERSEQGKEYAVILIPEGLIEFIPEIKQLISEINHLLGSKTCTELNQIKERLTADSLICFQSLPESIQEQFFLERDPHGNVQVSFIETEELFIKTVAQELEKRRAEGKFKGKFAPLSHFLGYEGRASFPSNFDAHYCYALGIVSALLIDEGVTGYMAVVDRLEKSVTEWVIGALPIVMLMNFETRHGKQKPVIKKALVDLQGKAFQFFKEQRERWALEDDYLFPGPIQFFGDESLTNSIPLTLQLERDS